MKYDKVNENVGFIESTHEYLDINTNDKYISVTTLIGKFHKKFDKNFWSNYKALEKYDKELFNISKANLLKIKNFNKEFKELLFNNEFISIKQSILDEWDKTNKDACERGTAIHLNFENEFYNNGENNSLQKFGIGGKFKCIKGKTILDDDYGLYPEYLIHFKYKNILLAGQIDLLIKNGDTIQIIDHKTNKSIDTKSYFNKFSKKSERMLYPLNNLDDCNYWHYAMQLSTYMYMVLSKFPEFKPGKMILNHIDHNDVQTLYDIPYLKEEVVKMLNEYSKIIKKEKNRERIKKVEYVRGEN